MSWQFTVGVMAKGKAERIVVGAEDASPVNARTTPLATVRLAYFRPEVSCGTCRLRSLADISERTRDVRFTPESGNAERQHRRPLSASSGHKCPASYFL